jgi:predicted porin
LYAKYGYSFFQGDKWELSGSLGLYYLDTALTVRGSARLEGGEGEVSAGVTDEASLDLPIPLFGLTAEYYITPKWRVIANVSYFTISFDEWDGSLFDFSANLEYLFHKNFGIGAGYLYFDADVERDRDRRVSHLDYEYQGVQISGIWHF